MLIQHGGSVRAIHFDGGLQQSCMQALPTDRSSDRFTAITGGHNALVPCKWVGYRPAVSELWHAHVCTVFITGILLPPRIQLTVPPGFVFTVDYIVSIDQGCSPIEKEVGAPGTQSHKAESYLNFYNTLKILLYICNFLSHRNCFAEFIRGNVRHRILVSSLLSTIGHLIKVCMRFNVKQESLANAKVSARQRGRFAHCILTVDSYSGVTPSNINVIYTSLKSTFSAQQFVYNAGLFSFV